MLGLSSIQVSQRHRIPLGDSDMLATTQIYELRFIKEKRNN